MRDFQGKTQFLSDLLHLRNTECDPYNPKKYRMKIRKGDDDYYMVFTTI